ncbi:unnamed protein product [Ascophyllum nodosum]
MALSTSMAAGAGAGGAGLTLNPGMNFGANALAAPQAFSSFEPPPTAGPQADMGTGGRGAGGAYDLRSWEKEDLPEEDHHACLGMDVGTSSIKACLYLRDGGCKAIGGKGLPASILVDSKVGVKGVRRWLKTRASGGDAESSTPPKGVKLFHAPSTAAGAAASAAATSEEKCEVVWPLRLMTLRGKEGTKAMHRVKSSLRHDIKIAPENSTEAEDAESSGVKVLLSSPEAKDSKDREVWCSPEEILAMLIAGVKAKAEDAHGVVVRTCFFTAPSCLGDLHRVALQRAAFMAGLIPGRFVGAALAATVGYLWGRCGSTTAELKEPQDLILSVGMGASFLDVAVVSPKNASPDTNPDVLLSPAPSASAKTAETVAAGGGKKKKKKGAGAGAGASAGKSGSMEYRVTASVGDPACGGLDMDYLVARALLAAIEDSEDSDSGGVEVASDRTLWRNLLSSANQLRERLSSEPKASCFLKAGCCDADPSFSHNLELSRTELEDAIAGTMDVFRKSLRTALDRSNALPGQVKVVVLYGECSKTQAVVEEIIKTFDKAQIEHAVPGDCSKGAALLLAEERDLLPATSVKARDALSHKLGLVDRTKKGGEAMVKDLFPEGSPVPTSSVQTFDRKSAGAGLLMDVEVVEWVEGAAIKDTKDASSTTTTPGAGRWVTVQRLGNPLAMQDDSGYPILAEEVKIRFTLDDCGICVTEVESSVVPKKKGGHGPMRRCFNVVMVLLLVFGILGGGYWMLHRLETAGERHQAAARVRLTAFYEKNNPDKLSTIEETLARYRGRESVLFQRLEKQYGKPVPK